jgi:hypothetical protein
VESISTFIIVRSHTNKEFHYSLAVSLNNLLRLDISKSRHYPSPEVQKNPYFYDDYDRQGK